jgi:sugar phosphate isomerase/epimerase
MTSPLWALAAGCVPDAMPWEIPLIAKKAGFLSSGMWVDSATTWNKTALKKTKDSLKETGIKLIDAEVTWLENDDQLNDKHKLIIDVGIELSVKNILVVNRHEDYEKSLNQFYKLCEYADNKIKVCLEFGEFTKIKSLKHALKFVETINHPASGILIDLMHLNRSNEEMPDLDSAIFPYVQGCDFWQSSKKLTGDDYIIAAIDDRCCLGKGEANKDHITKVCKSNLDVSLEIRSKNLRDRFPNPYKRAEYIFNNCIRHNF